MLRQRDPLWGSFVVEHRPDLLALPAYLTLPVELRFWGTGRASPRALSSTLEDDVASVYGRRV